MITTKLALGTMSLLSTDVPRAAALFPLPRRNFPNYMEGITFSAGNQAPSSVGGQGTAMNFSNAM
jgi:hypothetical protein